MPAFTLSVFLLWLVLPLAVWGAVHRFIGLPGKWRWTILFLASALGLFLFAFWSQVATRTNAVQFHDTYYVVSPAGSGFLVVGTYLVGLLVHGFIAARSWRPLPRLFEVQFWVWHFGLAVAVLSPVITSLTMPRRYLDYDAMLRTWVVIDGLSVLLVGLAACLMVALVGIVSFQRLKHGTGA